MSRHITSQHHNLSIALYRISRWAAAMIATPENIVAQAHNSLSIWMPFKLDMSLSDARVILDRFPLDFRNPRDDISSRSEADDEEMAIGFMSVSSSSRSSRSSSSPFVMSILFFALDDTKGDGEVLITSHSKRNNAQIVRRKISEIAAKDPTNNWKSGSYHVFTINPVRRERYTGGIRVSIPTNRRQKLRMNMV